VRESIALGRLAQPEVVAGLPSNQPHKIPVISITKKSARRSNPFPHVALYVGKGVHYAQKE
jgi:hypothetical protein